MQRGIRSTIHRTLAGTLAAIVVVLAWGAVGPVAAQNSPYLLPVGTNAPEMNLKTATGKPWKLSGQREKTVLVSFLFLGSPFARLQLAEFQKVHAEHQAAGLEVVAVNVSPADTGTDLERYWEANKLTFPALQNGSGRDDAAAAYKTRNYPTSYLIGKDGKIIARWAGFPIKSGADRLKAELAKGGFK